MTKYLLGQLLVIITSRWSVRKVGNYCSSPAELAGNILGTQCVLKRTTITNFSHRR